MDRILINNTDDNDRNMINTIIKDLQYIIIIIIS